MVFLLKRKTSGERREGIADDGQSEASRRDSWQTPTLPILNPTTFQEMKVVGLDGKCVKSLTEISPTSTPRFESWLS